MLLASTQVLAVQPVFTDVTSSAQVEYQHYPLAQPPHPEPFRESYHMSGGAAAADYDGDGDVDLYVTRLKAQDILYQNNGDGTFQDVTVAANIPLIADSNGVAWGDVDADGDPDLYITTLNDSRFYLLINDNGVFSDQSFSRGAALSGYDEHHGMSVAFGDVNNDGFIDIHTNEWRPDMLNSLNQPANARLLLNRGSGQIGVFDDITASAGVAMDAIPTTGMQGTFTFTSRFHDMDLDGHVDLLIAGDFGTSRLFWNNGDGTFTDGTLAAGVGTDENGMGSAVGDVNGDGLPDWFVTAIYDPFDTCGATNDCHWGTSGNRLYLNNGDRTFTDATDQAGLRDGSWGWAATFIDYDNDGDLDLAQATGQNFPGETEFSYEDAFEQDALRFWENDGSGSFIEKALAVGLTDTGPAKGMLKFDFDNDGDQDLFFVNNQGAPKLYRNDGGNGNGWLRFSCSGPRHCLGARVSVVAGGATQTADFHAGSNFLGQDEPTVHFGIGGEAVVSHVEILWPNGILQVRENLAANTSLILFAPVIVDGSAANDLIYGENGDDHLKGHGGADVISGGSGNDFVEGGDGADTVEGGAGDDVLRGDGGDDQISGDQGQDEIDGDAGNDVLVGGDDNDLLRGGSGNDVLFGDAGDDELNGDSGGDSLNGGAGNDRLDGGDDADVLNGGDGADVLDGGTGDDVLSGDAGNDELDSGPGGDDLYAGAGEDVAYFDADDVDGKVDLYDGGIGVDVLDLRLSSTQENDPATQLEIQEFANFLSVNAKPASEAGITFQFFTLGLSVRNFEVLRVNGINVVGDNPVVYVDPDAVNGGSGTLLDPYNDWNQVVFSPGVTYRQKSGTVYNGTLFINLVGTADQPVVIDKYETVNSGSARPRIEGPVVIEDSAYVTLRSFAVSAPGEVAVSLNGGDHLSVIDCDISFSELGVWMTNGSGPGNVVRSNLISNNQTMGIAATLAHGASGDETYIDSNSIYANGVHGVEIQANYIVVERNEVAYNGWREGGTSGIHVFSAAPEEDAARNNIIRLNVTSHTFEAYGPDGNGIELDKWSSDNDLYGNISYNNGGQGLNMFRADSFHVFDNVVFDNMKSPAHLNFARPTELFIGSFSLNPEDQVYDYVVQDNVIVANGNWSGSGNSNIIAILVDAPTIFNTRVIQNNRYFSTTGGDFFLFGYDPGGAWGGGVGGGDIDTWNDLKVNGAPDIYGGVTYLVGTGALNGGPDIDILLGEEGDDQLAGADNEDVLIGSGGDDELDGGNGADRMVGGRGNDVYYVDDSSDLVLEFPESGADTVYSEVSYNLPRHVDNLALTGNQAADGRGNEDRNFLVGNDAANALDGREHIDVLLGNGGTDFLQGGAGDDFLDGGDGNDIIYGGPGADIVKGGTGEDVFIFVKGEGGGAVLDFEGNQALGGDLLKFIGYGAGATITYTGADGIYRIDFFIEGVPASETISLIGVVGLHPVDYQFE